MRKNAVKNKWEKVKLGEICSMKYGKMPNKEDLIDGGYPIFSGYRIVGFHKTYLYEDSEIVVVARGVGGTGDVKLSPHKSFITNLCIVLELKNKDVFKKFLFLKLSNENLRELDSGSAQSQITISNLQNYEIYIPPIKTQFKIASILSAYDDLIDVNERKIEILEAMAQLIYKEWFVKFRFPGHEKARMMESELGKIPEGWQVRRLGEVCNILMGQSPRSEFYNEESVGLPFHQGVTYFGNRFPKHQKYCTVNKRIANERDILFSVRAPVGRINIADKRLIIGRGLAALANKNSLNSFQFYQLKNLFEKEDILGGGTVFKSVTKNDMHNIKVIVPVFKIARRFNDIVLPIDNQIKTVFLQAQNLRHTRDMLLPKLISGEIEI